MADGKSGAADVGMLVLRLVLGGIFIAHGVRELASAGGLQGVSDQLAAAGFPSPYPLAVAALAAAIGGGLLVILGLFARAGALGLALVAAGAIFKVHGANGFFLPVEVKQAGAVAQGFEYDLALLAMALCVLLAGAGSICLFPAAKGGGGAKGGAKKA